MNEPKTAYSSHPGVVWDGMAGWDVTVMPGATGRVEVIHGAGGLEAESYWTSGSDPERQQHASPDEALARFLGAPR